MLCLSLGFICIGLVSYLFWSFLVFFVRFLIWRFVIFSNGVIFIGFGFLFGFFIVILFFVLAVALLIRNSYPWSPVPT